ncbi:MAG: sugar kinase [Flavobacteriaceae bacterium]|nr:sugar kinase [Flavobacteriaceae bacterium]|tara:strand:+ start:1322 stop:2233 length:912 start_codon:yes stop_codon:yes gene_type:complete
MNNKILITGTVAFDEIETPHGNSGKIIGGAGTYIGIASSLLSNNLAIVSIIGEDFPEKEIKFLNERGINTDMIEKVTGGKTFYWKGKYHENMINRDTITTELNVLEKFNPVLNPVFSSSEIVLLGNLHPAIQNAVINQSTNPNRFIIMDTMNFWMDNTLDELLSVIKKVNLVIINDEEAQQLTGEKNIFNAGEKILKMGPEKVIIKKGEHGSIYLDAQNKYMLPAFPVEKLVDPTGAGDSFAGGIAGFLATVNKIGIREIKEAMLYGTLTASFCVEDFGIEGLRTLDKQTLNKRLEIFKSYLT